MSLASRLIWCGDDWRSEAPLGSIPRLRFMDLNEPTIHRIHGCFPNRYRVSWTGYHTGYSGVGLLEHDTITLRGAQKIAERVRNDYYSGQEVK